MTNWINLKNYPQKWHPIFIKESIIKSIRKYFNDRNYHELESPILSSMLPQERYLDVLKTEITDKKGKSKVSYLIPSTERYNKIALVAGIGNHYVISKVFRGLEEIGPNHSAEFTMLEWYELNHNYFDLMNTFEELINIIRKDLNNKYNFDNSNNIKYGDNIIDLTPPFPKYSIKELLKKYSNINLNDIQNIKSFREIAKNKHYSNVDNFDWQTIFELIFANEIEPNLSSNKPCFVYDYPIQLCPLTKTNKRDKYVAEKVEIYLGGKEIGNGYSELTDASEQERRFIEEAKARKELKKPEIPFDYEMIEALKNGMPEVAGIGVGLDRLAMIFSDSNLISDVNLT